MGQLLEYEKQRKALTLQACYYQTIVEVEVLDVDSLVLEKNGNPAMVLYENLKRLVALRFKTGFILTHHEDLGKVGRVETNMGIVEVYRCRAEFTKFVRPL